MWEQGRNSLSLCANDHVGRLVKLGNILCLAGHQHVVHAHAGKSGESERLDVRSSLDHLLRYSDPLASVAIGAYEESKMLAIALDIELLPLAQVLLHEIPDVRDVGIPQRNEDTLPGVQFWVRNLGKLIENTMDGKGGGPKTIQDDGDVVGVATQHSGRPDRHRERSKEAVGSKYVYGRA